MLLLLALAQSGENVREPPPQPPPRAPELTRAPSLVEFHPADYPPRITSPVATLIRSDNASPNV